MMKLLRPSAGMTVLFLLLFSGCSPYTEQERRAMKTVSKWSNTKLDFSFSDISTRESDKKQGRVLSVVQGKFVLMDKKATKSSRAHGFHVLFSSNGDLVSAYVDRKLIWPRVRKQ